MAEEDGATIVTLHGGPLAGELLELRSPFVGRIEVALPCPASPLVHDVAVYDRSVEVGWAYTESRHPGPRQLEMCDCSLCPGHIVGYEPSVTYQHGDHPEADDA